MNAANYLAEKTLRDVFDRSSVTFKVIHGYTCACDLTHSIESQEDGSE